MFALHGTALGGGIVIGRARVLEAQGLDAKRYRIDIPEIDAELRRLDMALFQVRESFEKLRTQLPVDMPGEANAMLEVHGMILDDPMMIEGARHLIADERWNAEWAFADQAEQLAAQFDALDDEYMRERSRDIRQVAGRVLKSLKLQLSAPGNDPQLALDNDLGDAAIVVAPDISPADMLNLKSALGFVIDLGGTTSHTAILARSMGVPSIVGLGKASDLIDDDDWLILDGDAGIVLVAPDEAVLGQYRERQLEQQLEQQKLRRLIHVPSRTLDGIDVKLMANIELPSEAAQAREAGAQGIGLFRSEFLFLNRTDLPGEDEQFEAYREALQGMHGFEVTIRTLDVGADKTLPDAATHVAPNPALGQRAIRYCLAQPEMFLEQLRALLRASPYGALRILIPMLAHQHEIDQTLKMVERAKEQLRERGEKFVEDVPIGGMVEVPAAALSIGLFARRLDFLSIGTNDLVQYTLAIDRGDAQVAHLYDPFHPAVLELVAMTIRGGHKQGKSVSVCGEMAGDPAATRLLLGMGLTEFSMHPVSLLKVKREILLSDVSLLSARVQRLLGSDDPIRVESALRRLRESA
jgi:phosphoenolpyruvate-protein phosphotransferase (PTS system enzyme I)